MRSKRRNHRLHVSSHANVRSPRARHAWIASLHQRVRPRVVVWRWRGCSMLCGRSPAVTMHVRWRVASTPPSVNCRFATETFRHGSALPRHPGREPPQTQVQEARRAECAPRTALGHREGREETGGELRCRPWHGDRRAVRRFGGGAHHVRAACEDGGFALENPDFSTYDNRVSPLAKHTTSSMHTSSPDTARTNRTAWWCLRARWGYRSRLDET